MSLETSPYRYEVMTDKSNLHAAMRAQQERIMRDEMMDAKEKNLKNENDINLNSAWRESLEDGAQRRSIKQSHKQVLDELTMVKNAATMVRRAALRKLLEEEMQKYETELHTQGKAFYVKRT